MKISKVKRFSYSFYVTPQQLQLIKDYIDYNQSNNISKYTSDYIVDVFAETVMKDEKFVEFIEIKKMKEKKLTEGV